MSSEEISEAIEVLKHTLPYTSEFAAARNIAIRSLEAWDKVWKDILNHEDIWGTDEILEVLDKHLKEVEE